MTLQEATDTAHEINSRDDKVRAATGYHETNGRTHYVVHVTFTAGTGAPYTISTL